MKIKLKQSLSQFPVGSVVTVSDVRGRHLVAQGYADEVGADGTVVEAAVRAPAVERAIASRQSASPVKAATPQKRSGR